MAKDKALKQKKNKLPLSFYFTILSMLLFVGVMIYSILRKEYVDDTLKYVSIAFLCVYVLVFIGFIIYALVNKKNVKSDMKNMKVAGKTFKASIAIVTKLVMLLNVIVGLVTTITEYKIIEREGGGMTLSMFILIAGSVLTIISIIFFVIKKSIKIKKSVTKRQKAVEKEKAKQAKKDQKKKK